VKLPTHLLPEADQAKAKADEKIGQMITLLAEDIDDGHDLTYLWWTLAESFVHLPKADLATGLATAVIQLARGGG